MGVCVDQVVGGRGQGCYLMYDVIIVCLDCCVELLLDQLFKIVIVQCGYGGFYCLVDVFVYVQLFGQFLQGCCQFFVVDGGEIVVFDKVCMDEGVVVVDLGDDMDICYFVQC